MKTTRFLTLMAVAFILMLSACKPDPLDHFTDGVNVTTAELTFITSSTALCGAEVEADDSGLLLELGVCWSKAEHPTANDHTISTNKCSQPYACLLTQLEQETKYYLRAYAKYGTEYVYGEEKTFTTLGADSPAHTPVTTLEATEITAQGFISGAIVEPFGITNYRVGMCYSSTNPEPTLEDCEGWGGILISVDDDNRVYQISCPDVRPNTQYYYRALVAYDDGNNPYYGFSPSGYFYGNVLTLTTPEMPFTLYIETYYPDFYYGSNYIYASGYGECNQPELINQIGFCYSDSNEYPQYESDLHTTCATPTGEWFEFSSHIYNVSANKKYYVRSYARYMTDSIKYGNVKSVYTY